MRIKKIFLIMALTAAITVPLCAQQQAKGQRTLQYVVGKGDTISSIAQKILTPPQRKKLLESLASRKETLPLQVQDTMLFTFNADAQLLALDYSTKNQQLHLLVFHECRQQRCIPPPGRVLRRGGVYLLWHRETMSLRWHGVHNCPLG